ncbi:MAG: DoxX family protein [Myxococcales bacterium]|nr:DoxX family protein [Myxococcales bacterium]
MSWLTRRSAFLDDVALLVIRVSSGGLLALHGLSKVRMGTEGFANGLAQKGLPAPTLLAYAATLSELVGGALVLLGLFTRPAAASLFVTMTVAWITTHANQAKLVGSGGGVPFEYPFFLSTVFLALTLCGGGRFSLDRRGRS